MPSLMATSLRWRTHSARTKITFKGPPAEKDKRKPLYKEDEYFLQRNEQTTFLFCTEKRVICRQYLSFCHN
jgi:hypothetical protein